ncbi:integral membrane protein [Schizothecium vesticola]|uniref:Integral membrane protein n=1 Tax=Schizothecium vesticola TaxID=314040 RepID=A0AA40JZW2_9PEZI|nr:integral membrane protein [Schizothecium vesticola]
MALASTPPTNLLRSSRRRWDRPIPVPPILRPLVRAYLLGYASAVAPRLLTLLLKHATSLMARRRALTGPEPSADKLQRRHTSETFFESFQQILRGGLDPRRFPAFCALLVGGSTLIEIPLTTALDRLAQGLSDVSRKRLARLFTSFVAAWFSLRLLQSRQSPAFVEPVPAQPDKPPGVELQTISYAGRTLDLTLFAVTRAVDVIVGALWASRKARRLASHQWTALDRAISQLTDPALFAASSGLVMWAWFYLPSALPSAYNKWITSAASVDPRLILALRHCRAGTLRYGVDTGMAPLLAGMCADHGLPPSWGDPVATIPFPCALVHMGAGGASCELHAASRFVRAFVWSLSTYLPLSLLLAVRRPRPRPRPRAALLSAARSSAFLATFITLFYYGVCLARTRVGPRLLGGDVESRRRIDGGVCVAAGCVLCGWSILLEQAGRRKDIMLFVAPRALATLLPRRYAREKQWRETAAFAASAAVVLTAAREEGRVRGVLGKVLARVMRV